MKSEKAFVTTTNNDDKKVSKIKTSVEREFRVREVIKKTLSIAKESNDEVKVGAIITDYNVLEILGEGFNHNLVGDEKPHMIHAETTAILESKKPKLYPKNKVMFVAGKFPCLHCAALIVKSGISEIYAPPLDTNSRWVESNEEALDLFMRSNVTVYIDNSLKGIEEGLTTERRYE